jgi:hypothetical protein
MKIDINEEKLIGNCSQKSVKKRKIHGRKLNNFKRVERAKNSVILLKLFFGKFHCLI